MLIGFPEEIPQVFPVKEALLSLNKRSLSTGPAVTHSPTKPKVLLFEDYSYTANGL